MSRKHFGKYDDRKLDWLKLLELFAVILIVAFLFFRFVMGISRVSGESMSPTYRNGQLVFYNRLAHNYEVGDVVSVKLPSGEYLIKRIIATAGDEIDLQDGVVYINGEAETGAWVTGLTQPASQKVSYPLQIPSNAVFVLGDNREVSIDSRTYGTIEISQIRGKILGGN